MGERLITFEEVASGTAITNQYAAEGVLFSTSSGQLQVTDGLPENFVPVSGSNVLGDPRETPGEDGLVTIEFVGPDGATKGTSSFVSFFIIDAEAPGAEVTAYDLQGNEVFSEIYQDGGRTQTEVRIEGSFVARIEINLGGVDGSDTAAIDNFSYRIPRFVEVVTSTNASNGEAEGGGIFPVGAQVELSATPAEDFVEWVEGGVLVSEENPYVFTVDNARNLEAIFAQEASVVISDVDQVYDGQQKNVTVATVPADLPVDVTYSGNQTDVGEYQVTAEVNDRYFRGIAEAVLTIKREQTIDFSLIDLSADEIELAATSSSGLPVDFAANPSGTATVDASKSPPILDVLRGGEVTITASQSGNAEYWAAAPSEQTFRLPPLITLFTVDGQEVLDGFILTNDGVEARVSALDVDGIASVEFFGAPAGSSTFTSLALDNDPSDGLSTILPIGTLPDGEYDVRVVVSTPTSFSSSVTRRVTVALQPPSSPSITSPANGTVLTDTSVTVQGVASPFGELFLDLDGTQVAGPIPLDSSGNFSVDLTAELGAHTLIARSVNRAGTGRSADVQFLIRSALALALPTTIDEGQTAQGVVRVSPLRSEDLIVSLQSSDTSRLQVPTSVTIPAGQPEASFSIFSTSNSNIEPPTDVSLVANANDIVGASGSIRILDDDAPDLQLVISPDSINEAAGAQAATATLTRAAAGTAPLFVSLESSDPVNLIVPAAVTIEAGDVSVSFPISVTDNADLDGNRTVEVVAFYLNSLTRDVVGEGAREPVTIIDDEGPVLTLSLDRQIVGEGLDSAATVTISRNGDLSQPLSVELRSSDANEATLPATATIPNGSSSVEVLLTTIDDGVSDGSKTVTLTATAAGFSPGAASIVVSDEVLPDLLVSAITSPASGETGEQVDISFVLENQGLATSPAATQWVFLSDDPLPGNDALLAQSPGISLDAGLTDKQQSSIRLPQDPGDYWLVVQTDVNDTVQEVQEANNFRVSSSPIQVAAAYTATVTGTLTNVPLSTQVPLTGSATLTNGNPASSVLVLVTIHVSSGNSTRTLSIVTDANGNFATSFTPLASDTGTISFTASHPGVSPGDSQYEVTLFGLTASPAQSSVSVLEGTTESGQFSLTNVTDQALSGLAVEVLSKPINVDVEATLGGASIAGNSSLSLDYRVTANDPSILRGTIRLQVTSSEGATLELTVDVTVEPKSPRLVVNPERIEAGVLRGEQTLVNFIVTNEGLIATEKLEVLLPANLPWMGIVNSLPLPALEAGQSVELTLQLIPESTLALTEYNGGLVVDGGNTNLSVPFSIRALSSAVGDLLITAEDEYTYFAEGEPRLAGALVTLQDKITGNIISSGETNAEGQYLLSGISEGFYEVIIRAEKHNTYRETFLLDPGITNEITAFMPRETVTYSWTVTPTTFEEQTEITIETEFETNVPIPVVTIEPASVDWRNLEFVNGSANVEFAITNHGLIAANDLLFSLPSHPDFVFESNLPNIKNLGAKETISIPMSIRELGWFEQELDWETIAQHEFSASAVGPDGNFELPPLVSDLDELSWSPAQLGDSGRGTIRLQGGDFSSDTFVQLRHASATIPAAIVDFKGHSTIDATFELTGLSHGAYAIEIVDRSFEVILDQNTGALQFSPTHKIIETVENAIMIHPAETRQIAAVIEGAVELGIRQSTPIRVAVTNQGNLDIAPPLVRFTTQNFESLSFFESGGLVKNVVLSATGERAAGYLAAGETAYFDLYLQQNTVGENLVLAQVASADSLINWSESEFYFRRIIGLNGDQWASVWQELLQMTGVTVTSFEEFIGKWIRFTDRRNSLEIETGLSEILSQLATGVAINDASASDDWNTRLEEISASVSYYNSNIPEEVPDILMNIMNDPSPEIQKRFSEIAFPPISPAMADIAQIARAQSKAGPSQSHPAFAFRDCLPDEFLPCTVPPPSVPISELASLLYTEATLTLGFQTVYEAVFPSSAKDLWLDYLTGSSENPPFEQDLSKISDIKSAFENENKMSGDPSEWFNQMVTKFLTQLLDPNDSRFSCSNIPPEIDVEELLTDKLKKSIDKLNYYYPYRTPGNLAGGKSSHRFEGKGCRDDARFIEGAIKIEKEFDSCGNIVSLKLTPNFDLTVIDGLTFCPGNSTQLGFGEKFVVAPLVELERYDWAYSKPFRITFRPKVLATLSKTITTLPDECKRACCDASLLCNYAYDCGPYSVNRSAVAKFVNIFDQCADEGSNGTVQVSVPSASFAPISYSNPVEVTVGGNTSCAFMAPGLSANAIQEVALSYARQNARTQEDIHGVCARVRLQLDQEAVLTRDAFDAFLEITNSTSQVLTNLGVEIRITDENGNDVTSLFGQLPPTVVNLGNVDGSGQLAANAIGNSRWLLVPATDAAPTEPVQFFVGGTLFYTEGGIQVEAPLGDVPITVYPQAELFLKYFHQRDVIADDPFTDAIEPSEPYSLAVMVNNQGGGPANNLRITSAEPQIVENEKGLLIGFDIIGTEVAGESVDPSLTTDFGNIASGEIKIGQWTMTSTLQGHFIDYNATFEHVDDLGGPRLSTIKDVEIHEMIRRVQADRDFDDGLPDFLVNDLPDPPLDLPDTLHLSDGSVAPVSVVETAIVSGQVAEPTLSVGLSASMPDDWSYLRIPDPADGQYPLMRVERSDGSEVPVETNAWVTNRTFIGQGERPLVENIFHLLDFNSDGEYTLVYGPPPSEDTEAPSSAVAPFSTESTPQIPVTWTGQDNQSIAYYDIYRSIDGSPFELWLEQTRNPGTTFTGEAGRVYGFYSIATDLAGNRETAPATADARTTVSLTNRMPEIVAIQDMTITEGQTVSLQVIATDSDGDQLSYKIGPDSPSGVVIGATGILRWVTGEENGGRSYSIAIQISDNAVPVNVSEIEFTVEVIEDNQAPVLRDLEELAIFPGQSLSVSIPAEDPDSPRQNLSFMLGADAPDGATISENGLLSWEAPLSAAGSLVPINVTVSDDGSVPSSLSASRTYIVRVLDSPVLKNSSPVSSGFVGLAVPTNSPPIAIDLAGVFSDEEDASEDLIYSIVSTSNQDLFSNLSVDNLGNFLVADLNANSAGSSEIIVRAQDSGGLYVDSPLAIVSIGDDYTTWIADFFPPSVLADRERESVVWGKSADPDKDGFQNIVEFALFTNPLAQDGPNIASDFSVQAPWVSGDLRFYRRKGSSEYLRIYPSRSTNLDEWELVPAPSWTSLIDPDGDRDSIPETEEVSIEINEFFPQEFEKKLFYQMIFELKN